MLGQAALGQLALGEALVISRSVVAETGVYTVTGQPTAAQYASSVGAGVFALSGSSVSTRLSMRAEPGVFSLAGQAIAPLRQLRVAVEPTPMARGGGQFGFGALGEFSLGQATSPVVATTTFVLTGHDVEFVRRAGLAAETGVYVLHGQDVGFIIQAYPPKIRIFPRVGRGMRSMTRGGGLSVDTSSSATLRARAFGGG